MPKIFISYRRTDSEDVVGRIHDRLLAHFSHEEVFRDVSCITPGSIYPEVLRKKLRQSQVVLAVIGQNWLTASYDNGMRRLDDQDDWVRIELSESLQRKDVLVIPLLVQRATLPKAEDIPNILSRLVKCQCAQVRPDPDFNNDINQLIIGLKKRLKVPSLTTAKKFKSEPPEETINKNELDAFSCFSSTLVPGVKPNNLLNKDLDSLKAKARQAEVNENWDLAKKLWIQVNKMTSGTDTQAIEAFQRIALETVNHQSAEMAGTVDLHGNATSTPAIVTISIASQLGLDEIWQQMLGRLHPLSKALMKEHSKLIAYAENQATIAIDSRNLIKIAQSKVPDIEKAFAQVVNKPVKISLTVATTSQLGLDEIWQQMLGQLHPLSKALMKEHSKLIAYAENQATIAIDSRNLLKIAQSKVLDIEKAFAQVVEQSVKINLIVATVSQIELDEVWLQVIAQLHPLSEALMKEHGKLVNYENGKATVEISSPKLSKFVQTKISDLEKAFSKTLNQSVKVDLAFALSKFINSPDSVGEAENHQVCSKRLPSDAPGIHEQDWSVGQKAVHKRFGTGQITHIFGAGNKICLAIKFPLLGQKIIDPKSTELEKVESSW